MEELGTHHVAAKFVPRILTADQKQGVLMSALKFISLLPTMKSSCPVITGGETWVCCYNQDKATILPVENPSTTPKKNTEAKSNIKNMIITFFDIKRAHK
jgi:hypothetical protein